MVAPYYPPQPPAYPPPPGYPQVAGAGGYQPPPAPPQAAPAAPPPYGQPPGPAQDMNAMMGVFQQMFEMYRQMQLQAAPAAPPPPPSMMMPPPPPGSDANVQMAWMQQAFDLFQRMQPNAQPPVAPSAPQPPQNPIAYGMPPVQPPPGMLFVPGFGFVPVERLAQAIGGSGVGGDERRPPPYRPRAPYNPQHAEYERPAYGGPPPQQGAPYGGYRSGGGGYQSPPPQSAPRTPADEFRDAVSVVRTAVESLREVEAILPNQREMFAEPPEPVESDSPFQVIDAGPAKIVVNRQDGAMRGFESFAANLPSIFKWGGEQLEVLRKAQAERQQPPQRQQLPRGYVEVTEGYRPPPGYVAVPVDDRDRLPPPPTDLPPPLHAPQQQQAWGGPPPQPWGPEEEG